MKKLCSMVLAMVLPACLPAQGMGTVGHDVPVVAVANPSANKTDGYPNTKFHYDKISDSTEAIGREIFDHNGNSFLGTMRVLSIAPHIFFAGDSVPTEPITSVALIVEQENTGDGAQATAIYADAGPMRLLIDDTTRITYTPNHVADRLYTGWTDDQSKSFWVIGLTPEQFRQLATSHKIDVEFQGKNFTLKN